MPWPSDHAPDDELFAIIDRELERPAGCLDVDSVDVRIGAMEAIGRIFAPGGLKQFRVDDETHHDINLFRLNRLKR